MIPPIVPPTNPDVLEPLAAKFPLFSSPLAKSCTALSYSALFPLPSAANPNCLFIVSFDFLILASIYALYADDADCNSATAIEAPLTALPNLSNPNSCNCSS